MDKIITNIKTVLAEAERGVKKLVGIVIPLGIILIALELFTGKTVGLLNRLIQTCELIINVLAKLTGKGSNVTILILVIAFIIISLRKHN